MGLSLSSTPLCSAYRVVAVSLFLLYVQDDPTAQRRLRLSRAESEAREASSSDLGLTNPGGMVEYGACTCNALESSGVVAVTCKP